MPQKHVIDELMELSCVSRAIGNARTRVPADVSYAPITERMEPVELSYTRQT